MKKINKIFCLILVSLIFVMSFGMTCLAQEERDLVPYSSFSYWEIDDSFVISESKALYNVECVISAGDIGVEEFMELDDICTDDNGNIYILDGKSGRIVILNSEYALVNEIKEVSYEGKKEKFVGAQGIFVDKNGILFIADTDNKRVQKCQIDGTGIAIITLSDDAAVPEDFNYSPIKITVDSSGYLYVLSNGSYYGALLYSPEMKFLGFYGANTVSSTVTQILGKIWDRLTNTDEKRATSAKKLPYQLTDIYVDNADFVYTATGKTGGEQVSQIRRLNPGGKNILDSDSVVFGNKEYEIIDKEYFIQNVSGVAVDDSGFIYCYDVSYGNIYVYDGECCLLGAFGGGLNKGEQKGTFEQISAIDILNNGSKIFVTDKNKQNITVFKSTEYGDMFKTARKIQLEGDYENSVPLWNEVLKQDANCQLAYKGIAAAAIAEKDYDTALKYAKLGYDKKLYSQAFNYTRKDYIEKNITWIMVALIAAVGVVVATGVFFKKRSGLIKNEYVTEALSVSFHPAEIYSRIKTKGTGSVLIGCILVSLYYVTTIIKSTSSAFLFRTSTVGDFNSLLILLQTVGFVAVFAVVNWAVAVLVGGIGKLREIFIVVSYAMIPMIVSNIVCCVFSYLLNLTEGEFLSVFAVVMVLYSVIMVVIGLIIVHDISFGKFVGITVFTFIGIAIVILLIALIIVLFQQTYGFFGTIINELFFR